MAWQYADQGAFTSHVLKKQVYKLTNSFYNMLPQRHNISNTINDHGKVLFEINHVYHKTTM